MKRVFLKYWWVGFPILLGGMLILLAYSFTKVPSLLEKIAVTLVNLSILGLIISWVILLFRKKWIECLLSVVLSVAIVCVLWFPLVIAAMTGSDGFGKKHPIPDGLEYYLPIERTMDDYNKNTFPSVNVDSLNSTSFLQVWGQFGSYYYDFYYNAIPAGEIFLRCFEVTDNIPLSEDSLPKETTVQVELTYSFSKLVEKKRFTINEGDYHDYYAARFEVWHRNATTGDETKLLEKIYRVEGYMR